MARVTKGWYVEGVVPPPTPRPDGYRVEKKRSRLFHCIDAAREYCAVMERSNLYVDGSVVVRTKTGDDKLDKDY